MHWMHAMNFKNKRWELSPSVYSCKQLWYVTQWSSVQMGRDANMEKKKKKRWVDIMTGLLCRFPNAVGMWASEVIMVKTDHRCTFFPFSKRNLLDLTPWTFGRLKFFMKILTLNLSSRATQTPVWKTLFWTCGPLDAVCINNWQSRRYHSRTGVPLSYSTVEVKQLKVRHCKVWIHDWVDVTSRNGIYNIFECGWRAPRQRRIPTLEEPFWVKTESISGDCQG